MIASHPPPPSGGAIDSWGRQSVGIFEAEEFDRFLDVGKGVGGPEGYFIFWSQRGDKGAQMLLGLFETGAAEDEVSVQDDLRTDTGRSGACPSEDAPVRFYGTARVAL